MTTIPLAEARAQLSQIIDEVVRTHERVEITRNGRRAVVLLSADDYDSLTETIDVLSDPELVAAIREGEADLARGDVFTSEEVAADLRAKGWLPE
jgi:prevent-host-death family protein